MPDLLNKTATTTAARTDLVYVVRDPSGTPVDRKMAINDFFLSQTGNQSNLAFLSLASAISFIGVNQATIEIAFPTTVSASLTIPSNVTLLFIGTGLISVSASQTLTINGPIQAPLRQIFTGSGSVVISGQPVQAPWFGTSANTKHVDTGAITSGTTSLTATGAGFVAADQGKTITVKGAGASGAILVTTIAAYVSSTQVTLAASASTTVSSKRVVWGTDDSAALAKAISAASHGELFFPPSPSGYGYMIKMTATGGGAVAIPSYTKVRGAGPDSTIYIVGSDGKASGGADDDGKAAFGIAASNKEIVIDDLRFVGENGPFAYVAQNQSCAITIGNNVATTDIEVRNCLFEDLIGFSVHHAGAGQRIHVKNCVTLNCANGINVNSDYSEQTGNKCYNSEGIEASGAYSNYSYNVLESCGVGGNTALSLGGRTSVGDYCPGSVAIGNVITDSGNHGIVLNDGSINTVLANNTVLRAAGQGIEIVGSTNPPVRNLVIGNQVIDCVGKGMEDHHDDNSWIGNVSIYTTNSALNPYAMICYGARTRVIGNWLKGGNYDIAPGANTYVSGNKTSTTPTMDTSVGGFTPVTGDWAGSLYPSAPVLTSGTGTGLTVVNVGEVRRVVHKVTVNYTALAAAATTADKVIAVLPAKTRLVGIVAETTQNYTGGAVSAATLIVGKTTGGNEYLVSHSVFSGTPVVGNADADLGTSINRANAVQGGDLPSWTATTNISVRLTTTSANTNALTTGSTTYYLVTERYP
jgi:hypothetical protein